MTEHVTHTATSLASDDPRVAYPLFTLSEAATYLALPYTTLHRWARPSDGARLVTVLPAEGQQATMPFVGFAEAFVLAAARRAGVPNHRIRPNVEGVGRKLGGIEHALASHRLYTDGAEILVRDAVGGDDLEVARTGQRQMTDTVRSQLTLIRYASDGFAARIQLPQYNRARVIVDPELAFGYPFVESSGARVKDLLDRFWAGESVADIAYDFSLPAEEVEDVIRGQTRPQT